jgi:hypothetical protein
MSFSVPAKYCPRCQTLLPVEAPICRVCGWQFGIYQVPTAPGTSWAPPSEQVAPEGWPWGQPVWPLAAPGFAPQGQPGPVGYAPAPAPPRPPRQIGTGMLLIGLAVIVVIIAVALLVNANRPSSVAFDRHGLQANVPLPDNSSFYSMKTISESGITADEWIWLVSNNEPASVQQFYQDQLPNNGWQHVQTSDGSNGTLSLAACQDNQVLVIGVSQHLQDYNEQGTPTTLVDAPQGGSTLGIILSSDQQLLQALCPGQ